MLIEDGEAIINTGQDSLGSDWQIQSFARDVWLPDLKKSSRSWSLSERFFRKYIQPYLGARKFFGLAKKDISDWLEYIDKQCLAPATRNRVLFVLKSLLKMAFDRGLLDSDILDDFLKKNLTRQERHDSALLESDKIRLLWRKLRQSAATQARVIELLLLTGASKSEILSARWENLDLEHSQLEVDGHNGKRRKIWLGPQTVKIFAAIARNPESPWIFPGRKTDSHLTDIFLFWNDLRRSCGLDNLRIQDLRHNYVNWQNLREGYSPAIESEVGNMSAKKSRQDCEEPGSRQKVSVAAVYTQTNDPDGAESVREFMRKLAQKFLDDPAFGKTTMKRKRCGFFLGLDPYVQRDFNLEICMEKLANEGRPNLPVSPIGFLKSLCRIHGPAIAVESDKYPVLEALRLASASIVSGNVDMALVGGMVGIETGSSTGRENSRMGVLIVLKAGAIGGRTGSRQIFLESGFYRRDQFPDGGEDSGITNEISGFMHIYENLLAGEANRKLPISKDPGKTSKKPCLMLAAM